MFVKVAFLNSLSAALLSLLASVAGCFLQIAWGVGVWKALHLHQVLFLFKTDSLQGFA